MSGEGAPPIRPPDDVPLGNVERDGSKRGEEQPLRSLKHDKIPGDPRLAVQQLPDVSLQGIQRCRYDPRSGDVQQETSRNLRRMMRVDASESWHFDRVWGRRFKHCCASPFRVRKNCWLQTVGLA